MKLHIAGVFFTLAILMNGVAGGGEEGSPPPISNYLPAGSFWIGTLTIPTGESSVAVARVGACDGDGPVPFNINNKFGRSMLTVALKDAKLCVVAAEGQPGTEVKNIDMTSPLPVAGTKMSVKFSGSWDVVKGGNSERRSPTFSFDVDPSSLKAPVQLAPDNPQSP